MSEYLPGYLATECLRKAKLVDPSDFACLRIQGVASRYVIEFKTSVVAAFMAQSQRRFESGETGIESTVVIYHPNCDDGLPRTFTHTRDIMRLTVSLDGSVVLAACSQAKRNSIHLLPTQSDESATRRFYLESFDDFGHCIAADWCGEDLAALAFMSGRVAVLRLGKTLTTVWQWTCDVPILNLQLISSQSMNTSLLVERASSECKFIVMDVSLGTSGDASHVRDLNHLHAINLQPDYLRSGFLWATTVQCGVSALQCVHVSDLSTPVVTFSLPEVAGFTISRSVPLFSCQRDGESSMRFAVTSYVRSTADFETDLQSPTTRRNDMLAMCTCLPADARNIFVGGSLELPHDVVESSFRGALPYGVGMGLLWTDFCLFFLELQGGETATNSLVSALNQDHQHLQNALGSLPVLSEALGISIDEVLLQAGRVALEERGDACCALSFWCSRSPIAEAVPTSDVLCALSAGSSVVSFYADSLEACLQLLGTSGACSGLTTQESFLRPYWETCGPTEKLVVLSFAVQVLCRRLGMRTQDPLPSLRQQLHEEEDFPAMLRALVEQLHKSQSEDVFDQLRNLQEYLESAYGSVNSSESSLDHLRACGSVSAFLAFHCHSILQRTLNKSAFAGWEGVFGFLLSALCYHKLTRRHPKKYRHLAALDLVPTEVMVLKSELLFSAAYKEVKTESEDHRVFLWAQKFVETSTDSSFPDLQVRLCQVASLVTERKVPLQSIWAVLLRVFPFFWEELPWSTHFRLHMIHAAVKVVTSNAELAGFLRARGTGQVPVIVSD